MLADSSFQDTLRDFGIRAPSTLVVPLTENVSDSLRPGQLRQLARWGPWVSVGAMVLTGVLALFTVAVARSRGKALAALGVSALIVGAAGWAGIEVAQRYLGRALDQTTGDVRDIVQAMVDHAEGSLHQWLNLTLAAGGVLVVFGVIVSMLGGLRRSD
jgi:divalent metal cation (Fe/Co/Zn/Cd) transporter